jgi:hypothetical protein
MAERRISHFTVRYDGEAHEAVGREIVRQLEHHYATLAGSLDFEPTASIPVILFTQEAYAEAAGVPLWAAGNFDARDGRIRLPIRGVTTSLSPWVDETLLHELTHAFIEDRTRGGIPHDLPSGLSLVHEGVAQYMSGDRTDETRQQRRLQAIADGRFPDVRSCYVAALSFVEYLVAIRGMGGLNDMLRLTGSTGSIDEAFRQVYGQDYQATKSAWYARLRQDHATTR